MSYGDDEHPISFAFRSQLRDRVRELERASALDRTAVDEYGQDRCPLCGATLYLVYSLSVPVNDHMTAPIDHHSIGDWAYTASWYVECEAGHRVALPDDRAEDYDEPFDRTKHIAGARAGETQ